MSLLNAIWSLNDTRFTGIAANSLVLVHRLLGLIRTFVIEVEHDGRVAYLFGLDPKVEEAFAKFAVLSAIMHLFVVTVDAHHVGSPP